MEGSGALLGISRAEVYYQFGVPDVNFNSVLIYGKGEKVMILIFGVSTRNDSARELTQGYIYGTLNDGVLECSGVSLLDTKDIPKSGDSFTGKIKNCVVSDIGSTFFRPALFSKDLTLWQLVLTEGGVIDDVIKVTMKDLLTRKHQAATITYEQANTFYAKILEKKE